MITVTATKEQLAERLHGKRLITYSVYYDYFIIGYRDEVSIKISNSKRGDYFTIYNIHAKGFAGEKDCPFVGDGIYAIAFVKYFLAHHILCIHSGKLKESRNGELATAHGRIKPVLDAFGSSDGDSFEFIFVDVSAKKTKTGIDLIVTPRDGFEDIVTVNEERFSYYNDAKSMKLLTKCITEYERIMGIEIEPWDGSDA